MTAMLTTPYRAKHPEVRFSIVSKTSIDVLRLLDDLEVDAGLTYLDNEPVGRVNTRAALSGRVPASDVFHRANSAIATV